MTEESWHKKHNKAIKNNAGTLGTDMERCLRYIRK